MQQFYRCSVGSTAKLWNRFKIRLEQWHPRCGGWLITKSQFSKNSCGPSSLSLPYLRRLLGLPALSATTDAGRDGPRVFMAPWWPLTCLGNLRMRRLSSSSLRLTE
jgi:hypothetical protein